MSKSFVSLGEYGFWAPDMDNEVFMTLVLALEKNGILPPGLLVASVRDQYAWMQTGVSGWMNLALDSFSPEDRATLVDIVQGNVGVFTAPGWSPSYAQTRMRTYCEYLARLVAGTLPDEERFGFLAWVGDHPVMHASESDPSKRLSGAKNGVDE